MIGGFELTAYGEQAELFASIWPGSKVRIEADLVLHEWKTSENKKRMQFQFIATKIETLVAAKPGEP